MDGYGMTHIASRSIRSMEDIPYCFPRSSVKFQGHSSWKIDLDIVWDYKAGRSYQIPQIYLFDNTPKI